MPPRSQTNTNMGPNSNTNSTPGLTKHNNKSKQRQSASINGKQKSTPRSNKRNVSFDPNHRNVAIDSNNDGNGNNLGSGTTSIFFSPSLENNLSSGNVTDASSAGYMTSEENHEFNNASRISSQSDYAGASSCSNGNGYEYEYGQGYGYGYSTNHMTMGVKLNGVMSALLDLPFLPFQKDAESVDDGIIAAFEDSLDFISSESGGDDGDEDENADGDDIEIEVPIDLSRSMDSDAFGKKTKKKRGALGKLRQRLNKNGSANPKKTKKNQEKLVRTREKHRDLIQNTSDDISGELQRIESGKNLLDVVKSNLRSTQAMGKKLVSESQQSANRVAKISKTITELEFKLDMALRSLEQEKIKIDINLEKIEHLNATEQALEEESMAIQSQLSDQLNTQAPVNIYFNGVQLEDGSSSARSAGRSSTGISYASSSIASPSVRSRANTDVSFMTAPEFAFEENNTSMGDGRRGRCASEALVSQSSVDRQRATISAKTNLNQLETVDDLQQSFFIMIHDLNMDQQLIGSSGCNRPDLYPIHIDDSHHAINSLMRLGLNHATDESDRWVPDRPTEKLSYKIAPSEGNRLCPIDDEILVWCGKFEQNYRANIPVVKARAQVQTSARDLLDLLFDSSKVKQYNKMSLGREDRHIIKEDIETDNGLMNGEVKVVRSVSSIPIIRKDIELLTLMHARRLDEDKDGIKGYICVNRSVWEDESRAPLPNGDESGTSGGKNYIRSEALLGVNLIRQLEGNTCEITTVRYVLLFLRTCSHSSVTEGHRFFFRDISHAYCCRIVSHFYTPGAPSFGAKQLGMKAAGNFLRDMQKQYKD